MRLVLLGLVLSVTGSLSASDGDAWRFLEQSTWGPTPALVERVRAIGYDEFLNQQFDARMSSYPDFPVQRSIPPQDCDAICLRDRYTPYPLQRRFFHNALYEEDQLRQRVAWALHKIFVISGTSINEPKAIAPYLQILDRHAFGNFRDLLRAITLNAAMGAYLNLVTSTRVNPNENYAREILQLFSIGTVLLNPDGTPMLDERGSPLPTYDQAVVDGFTHVLTGWSFTPARSGEDRNDADPLRPGSDTHDSGKKLLLAGVELPSGQAIEKDLDDALDNIFYHPNVGPFIGRQLIQNLVTSNPSPAYVARVSAVFDDNGSGVRGDLRAVVRAILLDPEARTEAPAPEYGHLKEPVLFITNVLRAFNARSANGSAPSDGALSSFAAEMGENVFLAPTVFSYYSPEYVAPGTGGLHGPEFGIMSTSTSLARLNFVDAIVFEGVPVSRDAPDGTALDLSTLEAMASDPGRLVDELDHILLHGTMSPAMREATIAAIAAVPGSNPRLRARQGVYLVSASWQYQVQR
jgi:uncharacterized protein (DUF1800 family)